MGHVEVMLASDGDREFEKMVVVLMDASGERVFDRNDAVADFLLGDGREQIVKRCTIVKR